MQRAMQCVAYLLRIHMYTIYIYIDRYNNTAVAVRTRTSGIYVVLLYILLISYCCIYTNKTTYKISILMDFSYT